MPKLKPEWVGELISICADDDWRGTQSELDWSDVSPMFRRLLPSLAESESPDGYSSLEVRACRAGLEWMSGHHPREFAALCWQFWPWKRAHFPRTDDHDALVERAGALLAAYVDRACG